ncbi:MAG: hypothetical protein ACJAV5_000263 [Vicingaceae bacterium]|jgi:hypothetical protein
MKLNWGTGIAIVYTTFVVFIGVMVYKAFGEDFDLVTEDYYAQEIKFQEKIDSRTRAEKLDASLQSVVDGKNLKIILPQKNELLTGSINCFRPSDETKDFTESFKTENGFYTIPLNKFIKGKYLIKVDWSANGVEFYQEQTIVIP